MNVIKLAELAGVSKSTVYRALNGEKIKESTKRRIMAVMKENNMADAFPGISSDGQQTVKLIGLVIDKAERDCFRPLSDLIKNKFTSGGFTVIDISADMITENSPEANRLLNGINFHSFVFVGSSVKSKCTSFILRAAATRPVILIHASMEGKNIYSVSTDSSKITSTVISKMINTFGHRKFLYCVNSRNSYGNMLAHDFENAIKNCGLNYGNYSVANCSGCASSADVIAEALKRDPSITAVIAQDDATAESAVSAAELLGLRIPQDISVIGYQNFDGVSAHANKVSCINAKTETISDMALMLMVSALCGRNVTHKIEIPCTYSERHSTGNAKARRQTVISAAVFDNSFISA